jgi:hypothetical protein
VENRLWIVGIGCISCRECDFFDFSLLGAACFHLLRSSSLLPPTEETEL